MNMYKQAEFSQTACNSSGLILDLARHVPTIWKEVRSVGGSTDDFNRHPVVKLFIEQLYHLASPRDYFEASTICRERALLDENL